MSARNGVKTFDLGVSSSVTVFIHELRGGPAAAPGPSLKLCRESSFFHLGLSIPVFQPRPSKSHGMVQKRGRHFFGQDRLSQVRFHGIKELAEVPSVFRRPRSHAQAQIDWPPRRTRLVVYREMPLEPLAHHGYTGRNRIDSQDGKLLVSQARHDVA